MVLIGITLLSTIPYLNLAVDALFVMSMPLAILYGLGIPAGAALIWRVVGQMRRRIIRTNLMERTRFVISDKAFYRATVRKDGTILSVVRTALKPGSTVVREWAAYVMRPGRRRDH
jgi:hypothetical protein